MVTDPISNFIISIKNAAHAGKTTARVPYSRLKEAIAEVLVREGYLTGFEKKGKRVRKHLEVALFTAENGTFRVHDVKRLSKPSKRIYMSVKDIKPVRNGYGHILLSTPQGVMTGNEAKKTKVGGEALFLIW